MAIKILLNANTSKLFQYNKCKNASNISAERKKTKISVNPNQIYGESLSFSRFLLDVSSAVGQPKKDLNQGKSEIIWEPFTHSTVIA